MAKRVDPLKAKEAKQRKLAIGLGVLLVAVVAFQGPKTLKMLKGPQPVTSAATATPTPAPAAGTPAPAAGVPPTPVSQPAVLADSDEPPVIGEGQLQSFELFRSKDPFAQQAGDASDGAPAPAPAETRKLPPIEIPAPSSGGSSGGSGGSSPPGVTGGSTPPPPPPPPRPTPAVSPTTQIAVNGKSEVVEVGASFPALEPTFVLVSLAKNGKSVEIGIAGGSYAGGEQTIKLELGKPLTLQNTADGTRYELELETVAGFPPPK